MEWTFYCDGHGPMGVMAPLVRSHLCFAQLGLILVWTSPRHPYLIFWH